MLFTPTTIISTLCLCNIHCYFVICFLVLLAEKNSKWEVLSDVLNEISTNEGALCDEQTASSAAARVLIVIDSPQTCNQIKDYLVRGPDKVLKQLITKFEDPPAKEAKEVICTCLTLGQNLKKLF